MSNPINRGHFSEFLKNLRARIGPIPVPIPRAKKKIPNPSAAPTNSISLPANTRKTPANPPPAMFHEVLAKIIRNNLGSDLILFCPSQISLIDEDRIEPVDVSLFWVYDGPSRIVCDSRTCCITKYSQ